MHLNLDFDNLKVETYNKYIFNVNGSLQCSHDTYSIVSGSNGQGKTLLLSTIARSFGYPFGFIKNIFDGSGKKITVHELKVAFVRQQPLNNYIGDTLSEEFLVTYLNSDKEEYEENLIRLLQSELDFLVKESNYFIRNVSKMSSGEQQMVAVAMALLTNADIILLDEPFERLSQSNRQKLLRLLTDYRTGKFILMTSHTEKRHELDICEERHKRIYKVLKTNNTLNVTSDDLMHTTLLSSKLNKESLKSIYVSYDSYSIEKKWSNNFSELPQNNVRCISGSGEELLDAPIDGIQLLVREKKNVLFNITALTLKQGINIIYGDNGAGKTLTAKFLAGEFPINPIFANIQLPYRSLIFAKGKSPLFTYVNSSGKLNEYDLLTLRRKLHSFYVPSEPENFLATDTPRQEIETVCDEATAKNRLIILKEIGIDPECDRTRLSVGQQKALVFLTLPQQLYMLILDEPFANMSQDLQRIVSQIIIQRLNAKDWTCVVITSNRPVSTIESLNLGEA